MTVSSTIAPPGFSSAGLRRYRAVWLTAAAGAALSLLLFTMIRDWERREAQGRFETIARQRVELLRESIGRSLGSLHAVAGLFSTGLPVDRASFRRFVEPALQHQPALQALSWTPRVPAADRAAVEAAVRAEGFPDFEFTERNLDDGSLSRAPEQREAYFPILLIEPLATNRTVFGRDHGNPPGTSFRARDEGRPVSSSLMKLLQEERNQPGLIVHFPIFHGPVPATVEDRRARIAGFASAVFRMGDLVRPMLSELAGVRVTLRDAAPEERSIVYEPTTAETHPLSRTLRACSFPIAVADRTFVVTFLPTTAFSSGRATWESWTTLACGLVITALCAGYVASWLRRSHQIARANAALQAEVVERKHAEECAAAANRAKTSFVTHLSHEIRTPLNAILGYSQLLDRDTTLPPRHREAINTIASSGRHLLGLLNSVLDLSRIEAGRAELCRGAFHLPALMDGLAAMFLPRCAEKRIALRIDCRVPEARNTVLGDEGKLRQVLINLVSNAIKFTDRGEVVVRVQPATGADAWMFDVIDTGVGLAETERASLFRPFFQTDEGSRQGGSGLGLAIARGHVQLMGGRLEVESKRGAGARFFFAARLPAAVIAAAPKPAALGLPRLAPGVRVQALVIDDNRDNRQILARLLADIGCAVAEAGTARDARGLARQGRPDVVFIDVFLTETTGPELLAALRADGLPAATPVLLHTAALLTREQHDELRATGADLLQKPFRVEDLCACLRKVPGVQFCEAAVTGRLATAAAPEHLEDIEVPDELCDRMRVAAELHNTTALKECLPELRQLGPSPAALADHLKHLLRSYDLAAIARVLREVRARPTVGSGTTAS